MAACFSKALRYLLIAALLFNVPYAGLHAVQHLPIDSQPADTHAHAFHDHDHETYPSLSPSLYPRLALAAEAEEDQSVSDIHFCHACQLLIKLSVLGPMEMRIGQVPLIVVESKPENQQLARVTTHNSQLIRGPPVIF